MRRAAPLAALLLLSAAPAPFDLGSISGDWIMEENGRWTQEQWGAMVGGTIQGISRSGKGRKPDSTEVMRIDRDDAGVLTFWAQPDRTKAATPFKLVRSDSQQLMFENLAHDYPQRIIYFRSGGWLFAKIMMADGSKEQNFTYRPANPPRPTKDEPLPSLSDVETEMTHSHMCKDNGFTLCEPPRVTHIRNLVCWPMRDLAGYIQPYRSSPAADCSFESYEKPLVEPISLHVNGEKSKKRPIKWRASWARLHFIETDDCSGKSCKREWHIPRD